MVVWVILPLAQPHVFASVSAIRLWLPRRGHAGVTVEAVKDHLESVRLGLEAVPGGGGIWNGGLSIRLPNHYE